VLNQPMYEMVIYEMHVGGFTRHPSSGVGHAGTMPTAWSNARWSSGAASSPLSSGRPIMAISLGAKPGFSRLLTASSRSARSSGERFVIKVWVGWTKGKRRGGALRSYLLAPHRL